MIKNLLALVALTFILSCKTTNTMQYRRIDPTGYGYSQAYEVMVAGNRSGSSRLMTGGNRELR